MPKTSQKQKTLVLLDAHAILHRAYHALPSFTSPTGEPTGALYGFSSMLMKIIRELNPDYIAACYDMKAPTFRHIVYEQYKGTRAKTDDELAAQFDVSRDIVRAFGIPVYEKETFEADDIIGTIVEKTKENKNLSVIIASGDLDTLQLVKGKRVRVYTLRKGIQDTLLYDEHAVQKRFGFAPGFLPDFKGLKGDPSDNIPGIPGIGDKTAALLIQKFGALENILLLAKKEREKLKKAGITERIINLLQEHEEQALFSKELALMRKDAPIAFSLNNALRRDGAKEKAVALFQKLGFASLLSRLAGKEEEAAPSKRNAARASSGKNFWKELRSADERYWIAHEGQLFISTEKKIIYALSAKDITDSRRELERIFQKQNRAYDAKSILHFLDEYGIRPVFKDDVQILFWLADTRRADLSIENMARMLFPSARPSFSDSFSSLPDAFQALADDCLRKGLEKVYRALEMPLIEPLFSMEKEGILVDARKFKHLEEKTKRQLGVLEKEIHTLAGMPFNINSPKELSAVLFEKLRISAKGIRKTGTGQRSTRFSELTKLKGAHPLIEHIISFRELGKLYSTYITVLPGLAGKDGRIHSTFHQTGTVTGRLSSSDPNLQNIPTRSELGDEIRRSFRAKQNHVFLACDYSQIQLRIAAMLSGEERMLDVFRKGEDIHQVTASRVFDVSEKSVTPEMRRKAKVINFGILYGMGARALAETIGVAEEEALIFLDHYFSKFPTLFGYFEKVKRDARQNGYAETLFGRKRFLPDINSHLIHIQREAERMAVNMPIQGLEADIIKKAMRDAYDAIHHDAILRAKAKMILQVHDELLFEVHTDALARALEIIPSVLEHAFMSDRVEFAVDVKIGPNWADLKSVKLKTKSEK